MTTRFYERYWETDWEELADFNRKWPTLAPLVPRAPGITVLDFGCGNGHVLSEIARLNPHAKLIGLDVAENALVPARAKVPAGDFRKIDDGGPFPVAAASVDFVFTSEVIEHVHDTENAFRELKRIVRPGGSMLVTVPYHGFLKNLALVLFRFESHFNPTGSHIRFYTKRSLTEMLAGNGFTVTRCGYYGRFYPFSHSIFVIAERVRG